MGRRPVPTPCWWELGAHLPLHTRRGLQILKSLKATTRSSGHRGKTAPGVEGSDLNPDGIQTGAEVSDRETMKMPGDETPLLSLLASVIHYQ